MQMKAWLIYRASDKSLRCVKSKPSLAWDEIAYGITLNVPAPWGRIGGEVEITLPETPPSEIVVTEIATPA